MGTPPGNGLAPAAGMGMKMANGTHATQLWKYCFCTSQMPWKRCAQVPAKMITSDRTSSTTVSRSDASGLRTRRASDSRGWAAAFKVRLFLGVELHGLEQRVERAALALDQVGRAVQAEEPRVARRGVHHGNPVALRGIPVGVGRAGEIVHLRLH